MALTLLKKVKARYKLWTRKRLFKQEQVDSWYEYFRKRDFNINGRSGTINGYYEGYKYLEIIDSERSFEPYGLMEGLYKRTTWCLFNCKGMWRHDFHRVIKQEGIKDNILSEFYVMNELGGSDILVFAFMNEEDYIWFKLKFL